MGAKKLLFVINTKSGSSDNTTLEDTVHKVMGESGLAFQIIELQEDHSKERIQNVLKSFDPQIVVAVGGDGTVNFVASLIAGMSINLGIIPTGSANGLAFELGIPSDTEEALRLIVNGTAQPMDMVRLNDEHISLHLSDLGINARIIKEFEKEGKRGFMAYARHFIKEIARPQKNYKCKITSEHYNVSTRAYMTLIANARRYRTGANINPSGKTDDGLFEVIIIRPFKGWIWRSFIGAFTGTFNKKPHVEVFKCIEVMITVTPAQEFQVDGENLGKVNKVHALVEKHALRLIYPVTTG